MRREYRLKHNASFQYIYRKGERQSGKYISLHYVPAYNLKLGVSVSKKVGKAVIRNLAKRRINEAFMRIADKLQKPHNYVAVVRKEIREASFEEIQKELVALLTKAGHLDEKTLGEETKEASKEIEKVEV